jgi:hypothetical protein
MFGNILSRFKWLTLLLILVVFYTSLAKTQLVSCNLECFSMILERKLYECLVCEVLGRIGMTWHLYEPNEEIVPICTTSAHVNQCVIPHGKSSQL